jgi:hypothetical protein
LRAGWRLRPRQLDAKLAEHIGQARALSSEISQTMIY